MKGRSMPHLEGYLFVPFGGQRRFSVLVEDADQTLMYSRRDHDHMFDHSPAQHVTCSELVDDDGKYRESLVLQAMRNLDLPQSGHKILRCLEGGVRVELYHPKE